MDINDFQCDLLDFMAKLHDCHICKHPIEQINGRGKKRAFCTKYNMPIQRVRWHCIDRFFGLTEREMSDITSQLKAGKCSLGVNEVLYA